MAVEEGESKHKHILNRAEPQNWRSTARSAPLQSRPVMFSKIHAFAIQASLTLVMGLSSTAGWAERADRDKPLNIEADNLRHDELKQISVFTGKVVATKGSIVMRGNRLEVRQDPEGYQHAVLSAEDNTRAFFRQKREGLNEFMEGEAHSIEYDGRADQVRFNQRAELRRLRGTVVSDEIVGQSITYNNLTEVFTVDGRIEGSKTTPALGVKPDGARVRAVLSPRTDSGAKK
jgi:lipopolysaccharide export system protein LptA